MSQNKRSIPKSSVSGMLVALALLLLTAVSQQRPAHVAAQSIIVQGRSLDEVIAAVESVGGTVTHKLDIIDGVGALLTPKQQQLLKNNRSISHLAENYRVQSTASNTSQSASSSLATVRDEFSEASFSLNAGTENWKNNWKGKFICEESIKFKNRKNCCCETSYSW